MSRPAEAVYTHGHDESVLRSHTWRTAQNSAAYLLPYLKPTMTILDLGCGPGTITADLAGYVPEGHITGLDAAADVLDKARAHAEGRKIANITFTTGDVHALPFPDATFDVTHAHQVLQHVADPVQMLREMRRVTKPGGFVATRETDFGGMFWYPESEGMSAWHRTYERVARANGGEPHAGRRLLAWARQAGFDPAKVTCTGGTWCYATLAERSWWGGLWADRLVQSNFATTAVGNGIATIEEVRALSEAWREWLADEDAWFYVPHGEIVCVV
ncbi:UbiE family methyltransferase [Trametopsis cervina]|nr:UbiE family methyltransferase [Trametopsis cervina]